MRRNVTVTWQCHWRPGCVAEIRTGQLWAPLAEAMNNPLLINKLLFKVQARGGLHQAYTKGIISAHYSL